MVIRIIRKAGIQQKCQFSRPIHLWNVVEPNKEINYPEMDSKRTLTDYLTSRVCGSLVSFDIVRLEFVTIIIIARRRAKQKLENKVINYVHSFNKNDCLLVSKAAPQILQDRIREFDKKRTIQIIAATTHIITGCLEALQEWFSYYNNH